MITLRNLSKHYGNKAVLHAVNLSFEPGKVHGIVGENGAGKTTLFRCIAGMESFNGEIDTQGENLKNKLGFLQTNPDYMSKMTGWEYLKLLCTARKIQEDDFEQQNIFELPLGQYAEHYSTGMKKKLALLGTLLQKNEVFILDEPFNGVDLHSNILITAIIQKLKTSGKTVLISSHIFSTLNETCDVIHQLKDGAIARSFERHEFGELENEMKSFVVGDSLEWLNIG